MFMKQLVISLSQGSAEKFVIWGLYRLVHLFFSISLVKTMHGECPCSYVVPSCCLTWHSPCKVSLFTFWNLPQAVILQLERCSFMFLEAYYVFHNSVLFIFLIRKFCASSIVSNFCQILNGSSAKFHFSPFKMLQRSQFWS